MRQLEEVMLMEISHELAGIAQAINSVVNVDVTIMDNKLQRVAGTGAYLDGIGCKIDDHSVFSHALQSGDSFIIENPREHLACSACLKKEGCREFAHVCCPIRLDDQIPGVIGLVAFTDEQRKAIMTNQKNLLDFLDKMASLISIMLVEKRLKKELYRKSMELEILVDSVDRAIVSVDSGGTVISYNHAASELFKSKSETPQTLKPLLGDQWDKFQAFLMEASDSSHVQAPLEFNLMVSRGGKNIRYVCEAKRIVFDGTLIETVVSFKKEKELLESFKRYTVENRRITFDDILGDSAIMVELKRFAQRASASKATILIQGESGTGKEIFARAIHHGGSRSEGNFIAVNCAAIPENLLESELFGYDEGAFTGARKGGKIGKFEMAHKGTLFLDEIGDMPLHLQVKLLRVLQEGEVERVGGNGAISVDVRIIAATHRPIEKMVNYGEFREDLFYRLSVMPMTIPPLKERMTDMDLLVKWLLSKHSERLEKPEMTLSEGAWSVLKTYPWPGNIRELENTLEYAVNVCQGTLIEREHLPMRLKGHKVETEGIQPYLIDTSSKNSEAVGHDESICKIVDLEKAEIEKALMLYGRNNQGIEQAAAKLGLSRATMFRKIKSYGL